MGVRVLEERPYRVASTAGEPIWIHDFGLVAGGAGIDIGAVADLFEEAFGRIFDGAVESDGFNRLVLAARLSADQIVVLRAYAKYLRQTGFPLSQAFIEQTLAANAGVARLLIELFELRFDPAGCIEATVGAKVAAIEAALENVANLNEDRVLRQYLAVLQATLRTNYWRRDAARARGARSCRSSSIRRRCRGCPNRSRCSRSSSTRRASRASTCAAAGSRAAACAGPTGPRISAPRCSAWSRRRW